MLWSTYPLCFQYKLVHTTGLEALHHVLHYVRSFVILLPYAFVDINLILGVFSRSGG